jgi:hypothetical protein
MLAITSSSRSSPRETAAREMRHSACNAIGEPINDEGAGALRIQVPSNDTFICSLSDCGESINRRPSGVDLQCPAFERPRNLHLGPDGKDRSGPEARRSDGVRDRCRHSHRRKSGASGRELNRRSPLRRCDGLDGKRNDAHRASHFGGFGACRRKPRSRTFSGRPRPTRYLRLAGLECESRRRGSRMARPGTD